MLQVFYLDVAYILEVFLQVFQMHVSNIYPVFICMLHVSHLNVSKVDRVLHLSPRLLLSRLASSRRLASAAFSPSS
jgi:hypothetical protein